MFCQKCGLQLDDSAKFCGGCAAPTAVPNVTVKKATDAIKQVIRDQPVGNLPRNDTEVIQYCTKRGIENPESLAWVYGLSYRMAPIWLILIIIVAGVFFFPLAPIAIIAAEMYYGFRYRRAYYIGMDNERIVVIQWTVKDGILEVIEDKIENIVQRVSKSKIWIKRTDDTNPKIKIPMYQGNFPSQSGNREKIYQMAKARIY